ncbi:MAG: ATP-binding protein, partial [Chloroflexota bacterium]
MLHDFRVRQRDFLLEITRAITGQLDLNEVLRLVLNASVVMLSGEVGLIALRELNGTYRVRATMGVQTEQIDQLNAQLEDLVADAEDGLDHKLINEKMRLMAVSLHPSLKQSIALPLVMAGESLGLLIVFRSYRGNATPDDIQILQSFADQATIAVKNAQLYAGINQERRRLSAILQNSADGIMILDPHLRVLSFNRALERMTGWPEQDVLGLHVSSVIQWRDDTDDIEEFIEQGWPYQQVDREDTAGETNNLYVEGDIIRQDDLTLGIAITYAPLVTRSGQLTNIIASVRDITNFRKAQEMQKMFVSTVSHELRTPITLIKGYAETLSRDDVEWNPQVVRDGLTVISEESDRLNSLVGNLITASKIQAQRGLEIRPDATHLDMTAERTVERFSRQAANHNLVLNFPEVFPTIVADEVRIRQVIDNLVSNALKYSPDGGTVEVGGKYDEESIVIYVRDEGIGMSEVEREQLFERFYRVDNALSRKTEGTGLGLYLSRAIIEAHNGTISVESKPGEG